MADKKVKAKNTIEISGNISLMPSIGFKYSREWEGGQQKEDKEIVNEKPSDTQSPEENGRFVFLRHRIGKWKDSGYGYQWRLITIWLSSFETDYLNQIEKVIYYLPKSFANPVREKTNREEKFYTSTAAYGDFNISAKVYLKNGKQPIIVNRLINVSTSMSRSNKSLE